MHGIGTHIYVMCVHATESNVLNKKQSLKLSQNKHELGCGAYRQSRANAEELLSAPEGRFHKQARPSSRARCLPFELPFIAIRTYAVLLCYTLLGLYIEHGVETEKVAYQKMQFLLQVLSESYRPFSEKNNWADVSGQRK